MPITANDITWYLSGGTANTDPNASLGGAISATAFVPDVDNNLFDDVSGAESAAGDVEFRCLYIRNDHATLTLLGCALALDSDTPSPGTDVDIGLGTAAIGGTEPAVADEGTAPAGVVWSLLSATDTAAIGDLAPGAHKAVWFRRAVSAGASAYGGDGVVWSWSGETVA